MESIFDHKPGQFINQSDLFTDRIDVIQDFWETLYDIEKKGDGEKTYRIITYTGNGGIGKTELLKKIERELNILREAQDGKNRNVYIDSIGKEFHRKYIPIRFDFEDSTDFVEILSYLRTIIHSKYAEMLFPVFDYALSRYEEKLSKKISLYNADDYNQRVLPTVSNIVSWFIGVDIYQTGKTLKELIEIMSEKVRRDNPELKPWYEEIDAFDLEQLRDNMVFYFARDISSLNNTRRDVSFVFLLDTFEILQSDENYITKQKMTELISNMKVDNILWIIAGRNIITIDDQFHHNTIIGNFSPLDSRLYLEKRGIKQDDVIERLYTLSDGAPIFLRIGADTYQNMSSTERENAAELFYGIDREELIKRYMKYLGDGEKLMLYMMSSMMRWTKDDIEYIFDKVHNNSWSQYEINFNNVIETPMIVNEGPDEWQYLHRVVRDSIYTDPRYPKSNREKTMSAMLELYLKRISENEGKLSQQLRYKDRLKDILKRAVEIKEQLKELEEAEVLRLIVKSSDLLKEYYGYAYIDEYVISLNEYLSVARNIDEVEKTIIELLLYMKKKGEAISRLKEHIEKKKKEFGDESEEILEKLFFLSEVYAEDEKNEECKTVLDKIRFIISKKQSFDFSKKLGWYISIIKLYKKIGNKEISVNVVSKLLDDSESAFANGHIKSLLTSDFYHAMDECLCWEYEYSKQDLENRKRFKELGQTILELMKEKYGENSKETVSAMASYCRIIRYNFKDDFTEQFERMKDIIYKKDGKYEDVLYGLNELKRFCCGSSEEDKEYTLDIIHYIEENNPEDLERLLNEKWHYYQTLLNVNDGRIDLEKEYASLMETVEKLYVNDFKKKYSYLKDSPTANNYQRAKEEGGVDRHLFVEFCFVDKLKDYLLSHKEDDAAWVACELRNLASDIGYSSDLIDYYRLMKQDFILQGVYVEFAYDDTDVDMANEVAIDLMKNAIEVAKEVYGDNHRVILDYQRELADYQFQTLQDWSTVYKQMVEDKLALIGNSEEAYIDTLCEFSSELWHKSRADAGKMHLEAIDKAKQYYGPSHMKTKKLMEELANKYAYFSMYDKAILLYQSLIKQCEEEGGDERSICDYKKGIKHVRSRVLFHIAHQSEKVFYKGQKEEAIEMVEKAIEDFKKEVSDEHFSWDLGRSLEILARYYESVNKEKADELRTEAAEEYEKHKRLFG